MSEVIERAVIFTKLRSPAEYAVPYEVFRLRPDVDSSPIVCRKMIRMQPIANNNGWWCDPPTRAELERRHIRPVLGTWRSTYDLHAYGENCLMIVGFTDDYPGPARLDRFDATFEWLRHGGALCCVPYQGTATAIENRSIHPQWCVVETQG